jgi:hypothetical protein
MTPRIAHRIVLAGALVMGAAALPRAARAQAAFEGVVTIKVSDADAAMPEMQYFIRNGAFRMEMPGPGGEKSIWITDPQKRSVYIVTPSQRAYTQMSFPGDDAGAGAKMPEITKTGKTETIAGYQCEQWRVKDEDGEEFELCLARGLGNFFSSATPMSQGEQAWVKKLGSDAFPLRFTEVGPGGTSWVVTRIEKRALDPALFAPPAGYRKVDVSGGPPGRP